MREISTEIEINAAAGEVWSVLTKLDNFAEWNPFVREASGEVSNGSRLTVRIAPPGGKEMTFKPTVSRVVPTREFRWQGRLLTPGIFDGEHISEREPLT